MATIQRHRAQKDVRLTEDEVLTLKSAAALMGKDASVSQEKAFDLLGVRDVHQRTRLLRELPAYLERANKSVTRRAVAARPLLARMPKKVGPVAEASLENILERRQRSREGERASKDIEASDLGAACEEAVKAGREAADDTLAAFRTFASLGLSAAASAMVINARLGQAMLDTPMATMALKQTNRLLRSMAQYGGPMGLMFAGLNRKAG